MKRIGSGMKLGLSPCPSSPLGCEHITYKRALELGKVFDKNGGEGAINSLIHEEEQFEIIFFNNTKILRPNKHCFSFKNNVPKFYP